MKSQSGRLAIKDKLAGAVYGQALGDAMAISICGAYTGASKIREKWRRLLRAANQVDFDKYVGIILSGKV